MQRPEEFYDILDIIRVLRGVWVAGVAVAVMAASIVGLWAFLSARESAQFHGAEVIVTVPAGSVEVSDVRKEVLAVAEASGGSGPAFAPVIDEVASEAGPTYRSLRVWISSPASSDESRWLDEIVGRLSVAVDQYDADLEQQSKAIDTRRRMIDGFLDNLANPRTEAQSAVTTAATAAAAAALLSALSELEDDARDVSARGRGPLAIVKPEPRSAIVANLQWLRFPIVAAIAGLLVVLFVGFTLDGIRVAEARRRKKA